MAFSSDGTRLATAGDDRSVRVWDAATDASQLTLTGPTDRVRSVAWSPDGTRLASNGFDGSVQVCDAATGQPCGQLTGHPGGCNAVAWSPDGTRLATAGNDGLVRVVDLDHPASSTHLRLEPLDCLVWSGRGIAVGGEWGVAVLELVSDRGGPRPEFRS